MTDWLALCDLDSRRKIAHQLPWQREAQTKTSPRKTQFFHLPSTVRELLLLSRERARPTTCSARSLPSRRSRALLLLLVPKKRATVPSSFDARVKRKDQTRRRRRPPNPKESDSIFHRRTPLCGNTCSENR